MINNEKKSKTDLLLRKNQGRRILDAWINGFKNATNLSAEKIKFVSLEETDTLKTAFVRKIQNDNKIIKSNLEVKRKSELYSILKHMASIIGPSRMIMFTDVDKYLGAVEVPADSVMIRVEDIWNFIGNDFVLLEINLDSGICIEINQYNLQGHFVKEGVLEINCWGKLELPQKK